MKKANTAPKLVFAFFYIMVLKNLVTVERAL